MKPTINFHHVSQVELTDPQTIKHSDRPGTFASRELILTDANVDKFIVRLFAETETDLMLVPTEKGALCS